MIDQILLRLMQSRQEFGMLNPMVQEAALDKETGALLKDFGKYFEQYPSHETIDMTTFFSEFPKWHKGITDEQVRQYARIMANVLGKPVDEDQKENILAWMADVDVSVNLKNILATYDAGDLEENLAYVLETKMERYRKARGVKQIKHIDTPIRELLKEDTNSSGLTWRLSCLNNSMRPLRGGDFGIIAGRPDKGKTSFIASEVSHFAMQIPEGQNILWLNNEGPGKRIIPRVWQAALNLTILEMVELDKADKLEEMYLKVHGRFDKVRVVDIHGMNNSQVEMIIEANAAAVVVYDMIDNIGGFGDAARTDLKLELMYQWARERAVKYDHIGLATSQISADGDDLRFPGLSMLKDSKTGKQGACDFQLMIGAVNDQLLRTSRFLGLPKNKLLRPGAPGDPQAEVTFDMLRSRYKDININPEAGV